MRSMKLGSACVRALLQRKRCVRRHLAKVCCYETMPAARCYSGSRDQGKIDQRGNTLASMEKRPFPVYRRCGDDGG